MAKNAIEIPESIRREHEAIHSALVDATRAPGRVGMAAKVLADVLHPHFVREEEIALPPLALLAPLAAGGTLPEATWATAAAMTSALRAEMPRMLDEHVRIRAAVAELRAAAESAGAEAQVELADQLALHARNRGRGALSGGAARRRRAARAPAAALAAEVYLLGARASAASD